MKEEVVSSASSLKNYAFLRLYFTAFALQSSRTEGVRTESKQAQLPFIGRSSFVPLWLKPVFPGSGTSFLTESAYFSHSFQYYDYFRSCRSSFRSLLPFHSQNSRHISRPPRNIRGKKRGKPLIYIAPYVLGAQPFKSFKLCTPPAGLLPFGIRPAFVRCGPFAP